MLCIASGENKLKAAVLWPWGREQGVGTRKYRGIYLKQACLLMFSKRWSLIIRARDCSLNRGTIMLITHRLCWLQAFGIMSVLNKSKQLQLLGIAYSSTAKCQAVPWLLLYCIPVSEYSFHPSLSQGLWDGPSR